jgi:hypothetical protein
MGPAASRERCQINELESHVRCPPKMLSDKRACSLDAIRLPLAAPPIEDEPKTRMWTSFQLISAKPVVSGNANSPPVSGRRAV